jgi:ABC-type spermidine/putrescine transport system permease subunit II
VLYFSVVFLAFPLFLPVPVSSIKSFACNNVSDLSMVWHRRLGHPNTQILSHVLNSSLLGNKNSSSFSLECVNHITAATSASAESRSSSSEDSSLV